jgi:hypothetical protein
LRLGWFVWTGKKVGRSQVLDIAIPADDEKSQISAEAISMEAQSAWSAS